MKIREIIIIVLLMATGIVGKSQGYEVTLENLLDEMTSCEANTLFPDYACLQQSSYDRRSVTQGTTNWFANEDGTGFYRTEINSGRTEKVLFEATGPGAITRVWITTQDRSGILRFYFDGNANPDWVVSGYDMTKFGVPLGLGLCSPHINNEENGKGGSTFYLPIPYANGCKVTLEEPSPTFSTPRYYHFNYRKYAADKSVETFSASVAARAAAKIQTVNSQLLNPANFTGGIATENSKLLAQGESVTVELPTGARVVKTLQISAENINPDLYAQVMRELVVSASFDGKETVWTPLSDFSGGGMGAPLAESWFLSADGKGKVICRYPMPYQSSCEIKVTNLSQEEVTVSLKVNSDAYAWQENSLYFYASWRQERNIPITNLWENCREWNFATLNGKGVFKGDVLTLFNHSSRWYGEGDEKIYVDNETFPSHFGTGTEDYYNCSWAPVRPFQTPFGGAPRADMESSAGYNTFFRLRCLDGIPFAQKMQFNIEMMSWELGVVDYATTVFWYGDADASAQDCSGETEAAWLLPPEPQSAYDYTIPNSIEFEDLTPIEKTASIRMETQDMTPFASYKWSKAKQLLCRDAQPEDYLLYRFNGFEPTTYRVQIQGTKAVDYGILSFSVNGQTPVTVDFYNNGVIHTGVVELGNYMPINGAFEIKITYIEKNSQSTGNLIGLDCVQFIESDYHVANATEMENVSHVAVQGVSTYLSQDMRPYKNGKWSGNYQKVYTALTDGNFVDFRFSRLTSDSCKIALFATRGPDFATISFEVNGKTASKKYDCYHNIVADMPPFDLGTHAVQSDGTISLRINIDGTNPYSVNPRYILGLDCIVLEKINASPVETVEHRHPFFYIENNMLQVANPLNLKELTLSNYMGVNLIRTNKNCINISHLDSGMYIASLTFDKERITEKIVVKGER